MNKCDAWGLIGFLGTLSALLGLVWLGINYPEVFGIIIVGGAISAIFILVSMGIGMAIRDECNQ